MTSNRGEWSGLGRRRERLRRAALRAVPADRDELHRQGRSQRRVCRGLGPGERGVRAPAGHAGRRDRRNSRRRPRHPPDQPHAAARLPLPAAGRGRGLHARRQLVELSAAQARRAHGRRRTAAWSRPTWTRSTTTRSTGPKATPSSASTPTPIRRCTQAGFPIDAAVIARNDDVVLIPEGYHPVSSPVGYTTYYLNMLAGSAQSLAGKR